MIFQSIPLIADHVLDIAIGTSSVLVVSPLQSLMLDQVKSLEEMGITAAAIFSGQSEDVMKEIEEGAIYSVVLISPESMLATNRWRKYIHSEIFAENCVGVIFDEAHCIAQW